MTVRDAPVMFRLLGPVEMISGDRRADLGTPQQRTVLACLAADAGRPVSPETLVDRIWGDLPPAGARASLYAHMTRIRHLLEQAESSARGAVSLARRSGGYVLQVDPDLVDVHRFHRLLRAAHLDRPDAERAALIHTALDLWQGRPVGDIPGDWAARMRDNLVKERLDAVTLWAGVLVRLGRPDDVVGTVRELVAEYPLAEQLVAVLMRSLAASGRGAEALELFTATRTRLAEELGADPGRQLHEVHQAVLRGEIESVLPGQRSTKPVTTTSRAPAQLPADVYAFTGRERELAALDDLLPEANGASTAVVISVVSGTAGVGKTTLALRWAHRVRDRFPDGQLYLNLRGYTAEQPLSAADALARMLSALGVTGSDVPMDLDDRAARYRTELSGRRMLLLLDNAATVDQVRPLLPGSPSCLVTVTSRDSLSGLVARDGARRLDLDLLPTDDAVRLLGSLIGARVDAEPDAVRTLAGQCARLPLALRVAAELAATRSALPLSELVEELADQHRRLDLLDAGLDHRTAVRAVFFHSYQHLTDAAAAAFRLIGLHPGPDIDPYAVAALNDIDLSQARQLLDVLARANLIQAHGRGRYGVHDLLRAYARDLADTEHTDDERHEALTRLFDFYVATAAAAMNLLHPSEQHRRPRVPPPPTPVPDFATTDVARSWLDAEKPNLVAACVFGEAHEWPAHTVAMAATLFRWLDGAGHNADSFTVHSLALRCAERTDDTAGEARALVNLGLVYWHQGLLGQAAEHLSRALDRYTRIADHIGQASALSNLGVVYWRLGRLDEAQEHLSRALDWYQRVADLVGQAEALGNLGLVYQRKGELTTAIDHHRRALALFQQVGYRIGEAYALNDLGTVHMRLGQPTEAAHHLRQALLQFRELDVRAGEAEALNGLGEALYAAGVLNDAVARHADALAVAVDIGDRYEQGRAYAGMAAIHESLGEVDRARRCREQALTAYRGLDVPEAEALRARLTARA